MRTLRPHRAAPATTALLLLLALLPATAGAAGFVFDGVGHTFHGDWQASVSLSDEKWRPGQPVQVAVTLGIASTHLAGLAQAKIKADRFCVLVTAERTFDSSGWMRLPSDERMSTLLTPTGLAIEGGVQGAVTDRYGYAFRTPFDVFESVPVADARISGGTATVTFAPSATLPADLPPGLYRLRLDFGVMVGTRLYNLNGYGFAVRPSTDQAGTSTYFYSPIIPADGRHVWGYAIDADRIQARFPWLLLAGYNSNGYRGVVAEEDSGRFATSDRSLIPDDVILPMFDDAGKRLTYSLEPQFPADGIDSLQNVPWDYGSGELSVAVAGPDGRFADLGTFPFVAKSGNGATTRQTAVTAWAPSAYGLHTVRARGWIADRWGRRYKGGGTYRFWIGRRMTLATATFQGMPYPVGSRYGRDIQFNPAVPADVVVTARLYVNSDALAVREASCSGKASPAGLFGAAQGMVAFPLDAAGEYWAHVLATYTDPEGHLWVASVRHAGIVHPASSPVVARGKKMVAGGSAVERGETRFEGYVTPDGVQKLAHVAFPYRSGDVLLIAAEGQGANKIEPVLTYELQGANTPWDSRLNGVGTTNLSMRTSNGYSPHLFPEYFTDVEYYYGAAPRPGFMGRFLVGESTVRAPYWPTSPHSFGGQIGASPNGDTPGDIYRLIGGVVLHRAGQMPMYAGYLASAFILPKGSNNNRVVAPGSEELTNPTGGSARFFLVGLRPGTAFEVGSTFRPAVQIDPILPASIHFELDYPDGRRQTADGVGDAAGSFAAPSAWALDVPGVYKYRLRGTWNGFEGRMPGLPEDGGEFYVYSRPPAGAARLRVDGATTRTFSAGGTLAFTGSSTAAEVRYALITPGAVIEQGELPVRGGKFQYVFDPAAVHAKVPLYDVVSVTTGRPQIGRVVHLTFFAEERASGGRFFDVTRVILRGTTALSPGAPAVGAPASTSANAAPVRIEATDAASLDAWDAHLDRLARQGSLRVLSQEQDALLPARRHERLQQLHDGVPIFGGEITRQVENGIVVSIFGTLHPDLALDARPAVAAEDVGRAVEARTGGRARAGLPGLVVLPPEDGGYALAWQCESRSGTDVRVSFTDAHTGGLLLEWSDLKTQAEAGRGRGVLGDEKALRVSRQGGAWLAIDPSRPSTITTLDLRGNLARAAGAVARTVALDLADVASSVTSEWEDGVVVDAHAHAAATYDVLARRFGRRGLDGRDGPILSLVHPAKPEERCSLAAGYGLYYTSSFWDGRMAVFGEEVAPALDLVAHELAHGVTDASSRLVYRGESGALNEAFSDILATTVEFAAQPAGNRPGRADYRIGEDAVSGGLRSLEDPAAHRDADHYDRRYRGADDNGGVHANATIASHAYFLAVEGGTNRTSGVAVTGVGAARRAQVENSFYRAFVYLLPPTATFSTARAATLQSARDLYGPGSAVERALAEAWTAVGVR